MKLFYREYGSNRKSIIILHGLFGSSKNWVTIAKELSLHCKVYTPDLRNHGDSPHSSTHTLIDMANDIFEFIDDQKIEKPILIGHSMGGLVTILFSMMYPDKFLSPIVVDIAPKNYPLNYEKEFACLNLDVSGYSSRDSIDQDMKKILEDTFVRQFLQMNLERTEKGYKWKLNVSALENSRNAFDLDLSQKNIYLENAKFIIGENSDYVKEDDIKIIQKFFPNVKTHIIKGAGHYPHHTHNLEFLKILKNSIEGLN